MGKELEVRIYFFLYFLLTSAPFHVFKVEIYYKLNFSIKNEQYRELHTLWQEEEDTVMLADPSV